MSPPEQLAGLPFPQQIAAIDEALSAEGGPGELPTLLETLAGFPDHEPLAHAFRGLGVRGLLPDGAAISTLLARLPDTGIQRVLKGLDRAQLDDDVLAPVCEAVARTIRGMDVDRLAAICLMDRWLKNADRPRHGELREAAFDEVARALRRGAPEGLADALLLHVSGRRLAELDALAAEAGCVPAWQARLQAFAERVLGVLRDTPRSLSQANAEEILSRRVYTDPGHFLVELLQNAEDAGASAFEAQIGVGADPNVSIWHDGAPFDAKDVVGVLSIGQTTKSRDQIGFFGVGFKSVYEICERPQVYSEVFRFEIADISIPRPLSARPRTAHPETGTLIVLPRRQPAKAEHASELLYERMLAVPPETLLTLSNLRRMRVGCGDALREVRRLPPAEEGLVELVTEEGGERRHARYLVASRRFEFPGRRRELSRAMATTALVALRVDEAGVPVALEPGAPTVFSHLPTGELSGLRFVIHAHFEVPVDRERLDHSSAWNRWALTRMGELLGAVAERLVAASDAALLGLLEVLPLAGELRHAAYAPMLDTLREGVAELPVLPAAGGGRLTPSAARVVHDAALAEALAGAELDETGRRACSPSVGSHSRRAAVAEMLGAEPFSAEDLARLMARHLSPLSEGEPWPTAWLAEGHGAILDVLGRSAASAGLERLALVPDDEGRLWSAGRIRRTSSQLRALYAGARPFVAASLDDTPSQGQAALWRALGLGVHGPAELVADLRDPALAKALLSAGALQLHAHLATLSPGLTAELGALPIFPDEAGAARPLDGEDGAWLAPPGPLGELVRGLTPERRVPLVALELAQGVGDYLRRLGARRLDLQGLLELVESGRVRLEGEEVLTLHRCLDALSDDLTPRQCSALAQARLFPTGSGLRRLRGEDAALVPANEEVEALVPAAPWLAPEVREARHVARLPIRAAGTPDVVLALSFEDSRLPLDPTAEADLARAYPYLVARAPEVSQAQAKALAEAPIWRDHRGAARALGELRRPAADPDLVSLFEAISDGALISAPALEVALALGLGEVLPAADHAGLVALLGSGRGADLVAGEARGTLLRALGTAARTLPKRALAPLAEAPIFEAEDGRRLPLGRWRREDADPRAHRAAGLLREALRLGSRPLLGAADEAAFAEVLDALEIGAADELALAEALERDPALWTPEARAAGRRALVAAPAEALGALGERLSDLALWPARDGRWLAATQIVRGSALERMLGEGWEALVGEGPEEAVLAASAEADAEALGEVLSFRQPVALIVSAIEGHARLGAPLEMQPALLASRERLWELADLLLPELGADATGALPLKLDVAGRLVARPLWWVPAEALPLTRGLALRERLADPAWAEGADAALVEALGPQRLLVALAKAEAPLDAEGRQALYRWLLREAPAIEADAQALGTLGNASLFPTVDGGLKSPRELLLAEDAPDDLGLESWLPASEVPERLCEWLGRVFLVESGRRKQLTGILVEAHRQARELLDDEARAARSVRVLRALAKLWPPSDEAEERTVFEWAVKNHKLRRLRVRTEAGDFEQIGKVLAPSDAQRQLLPVFLTQAEATVDAAYQGEALRSFLVRVGARASLGAERLTALLEGAHVDLRQGLDATLALARYVALMAAEEGSLEALAEARWVPDGHGERRKPAELYWPDAEVEALIGERAERYPHPEFFLTVPRELSTRLPFRHVSDARLADVMREVEALGEARASALVWLEDRLAEGALKATEVRRRFEDKPLLRDDTGVLRRPSELVRSDPEPWVGDFLASWSEGAELPKLASALRISTGVGPPEIEAWMAHLAGAGLEGAAIAEPQLIERLQRCLGTLARASSRTKDALVAAEGPEGTLALRVDDPRLKRPEPAWLVRAARAHDAPVYLALIFGGDQRAKLDWLRAQGVPDLREAEPEEMEAAEAPRVPSVKPVSKPKPKPKPERRPAPGPEPEPESERAPEPEKTGFWSRVTSWFGGDDDEAPDEDEPPPRPEPSDERPERPFEVGDDSRIFTPRGAVEPQLRDADRWLRDRTVAPDYGFAFTPRSLPFPQRYACQFIAGRFDPRTQRWLPFEQGELTWLAPRRAGSARVALRGRLPRGTNQFPLPLYTRVDEVRALDGGSVRQVKARDGRLLVVTKGPTEFEASLLLDEAPSFEVDGRPSGPPGLLEPAVPDAELPEEALDFLDALRADERTALETALEVRAFIQRRYRYDPSYLEDPAVAAWLRRVSRGRVSTHLAALHAGRDGKYLGRGVCYELGALACELLRRAGIPAGVAQGWTWESGQVAEPDHLWAMALLPSDVGPRWLPIDASTTRDGRPLRVGQRPDAGWRPEPPEQPEPPPESPEWAQSERGSWLGEGSPGRPSGLPQGGARQRPTRRPKRPKQEARPPIGQLMRVVRHLAEVSGERVDAETLQARCKALLADPEAARRALESLGLLERR